MPYKRRNRSIRKDTLDILKSSMTMGVGQSVLGRIGGTAAVSGQAGLSTLSRFTPTIARLKGAGYALRATKRLRY